MSLFRLEVTNKFPPYSHYLMHSVLTMLSLEAEAWAQFVQPTYEYLLNQDLPSFGKKKTTHFLSFKRPSFLVVNPICSSYRGSLIFWANVAGCGCHSFGGRCFLCILWTLHPRKNSFIPLWPIVHNSYQQHTQHTRPCEDKTGERRKRGRERGREHSGGRSTDRGLGHRRDFQNSKKRQHAGE